ncbi:hypothetical protein [Polaromonas sp. CG_9.11]|uniref:hypothetical protein n=1 Tax=Polaromonas sp. CG_9.11 TaxID=2787730 RepID=UPI0018CA98A0|nr:hypothetical protein [Polaromonas sp. CG_9.11]MBG6076890.1 hypothetical protein [Polaromonas sp. CG_9.11]
MACNGNAGLECCRKVNAAKNVSARINADGLEVREHPEVAARFDTFDFETNTGTSAEIRRHVGARGKVDRQRITRKHVSPE